MVVGGARTDPADVVADVLDHQAGVIGYRQAVALGFGAHDIRRKVRRREWAAILPAVYVAHTGAPSWEQRAWAAVLWAYPAALTHESAMRWVEGPRKPGPERVPIHVVIDHSRRLRPPHGVIVHRSRVFARRLDRRCMLPRVRYDEAVIDTCASKPERWDRFETIARACRDRYTSANRLRRTLAQRPMQADRAWMLRLLDDVGHGSCSVLEQGYLESVERAHGLPPGVRQHEVRATMGMTRRDVQSFDVVIELDGRLHHGSAGRRDRDLDRDLDAWVRNEKAVRLGYGQVFERPCETARRVALLLQRGGWTGRPRPCGPNCVVATDRVH